MTSRTQRIYPYILFPALTAAILLAVLTGLVRTADMTMGDARVIQGIYKAAALAAPLLAAGTAGLGFTQGLRKRSVGLIPVVTVLITGYAALPGIQIMVFAEGSGYPLPAVLHQLAAILGLGGLILAAARFYLPAGESQGNLNNSFTRLSLLSAAAGLAVIISGFYLGSSNSAGICTSWPLCNGFSLAVEPGQWPEVVHRIIVGIAVILVSILMLRGWKEMYHHPVTLTAITAGAALYMSQALLGGLSNLRGHPLDLVILHSTASAAAWGALVVAAAAIIFDPQTANPSSLQVVREPIRARLKDFLQLTKPVIVILLLVTTYAGMVLGARAIPPLELTFWTLLAGAMAAGGSGAINQYIDRELDQRMQRTAQRPLPAGRLTPAEGLAFGVGLLVAAFFIMAAFANLLAAALSLAGMIYYILLYSIFLKKATVQNIVIGGGAGAIPPLVGWAAAAGNLSVPSLFLFAIVFLWTPPHFWALALVRRKDYARAGVPMLPVVRGEKATRLQILIYTLELVGLTLLMPAFRLTGSLFLVSAGVLGGALIFSAWRVFRLGGNKTAWQMYRYSSMYLAFIFAALVLDVLL